MKPPVALLKEALTFLLFSLVISFYHGSSKRKFSFLGTQVTVMLPFKKCNNALVTNSRATKTNNNSILKYYA
jgi:hypothetical protein